MYLRHLTSRLRKITKHKSHLQSSVYALIDPKLHIQLEMIYSIFSPGRFWFETEIKMLWRIKAWMYLRHLTSRLRKIRKQKSDRHLSVFFLNQTKFTHSTRNYFFYGQFRWILIWRTNENVMKDKSLNVPATLDIAPQKNHKAQISSSIVCFLLESNKNYTFNWKWVFQWSIQVDFDLKHK